MRFESYPEFLNWLYSLKRFGMSYGVDNIKGLLKLIGNPQELINCVLITGSGGKGSVTYLVSKFLENNGYKVGRFSKPHLHRYTERICVNSKEIEIDRLLELANYIYSKINNSDYHPTFFEFTTALSMLYFLEENCDICVYEVGIGGRYDATNVLNPCISAITTVYLEHTNILGNTVEEIAWNKAGIARKDAYLILGETSENAVRVVKEECEKVGSELLRVGKDKDFDIKYERIKSDIYSNIFNYHGLIYEFDNLETSLLGYHQFSNCAVALGIIEILDMLGYDFKEKIIRKTLAEAKFYGRLEMIKKNNLIILDSAKDPFAIKVISQFLKDNFEEKFVVIMSISSDKDYRSMLKNISEIADFFIFSEHKVMNRAIKKEILAKTLEELGIKKSYLLISDVKEAVKFADSNFEKPILVTGSVFTVAEAREYLLNEKTDNLIVSDPI